MYNATSQLHMLFPVSASQLNSENNTLLKELQAFSRITYNSVTFIYY